MPRKLSKGIPHLRDCRWSRSGAYRGPTRARRGIRADRRGLTLGNRTNQRTPEIGKRSAWPVRPVRDEEPRDQEAQASGRPRTWSLTPHQSRRSRDHHSRLQAERAAAESYIGPNPAVFSTCSKRNAITPREKASARPAAQSAPPGVPAHARFRVRGTNPVSSVHAAASHTHSQALIRGRISGSARAANRSLIGAQVVTVSPCQLPTAHALPLHTYEA